VDGTRNVFSGNAENVLQVGNVHGDVNVHYGPAEFDRLERAAESLAAAVGEQWRREAEARSLNRPRPLRVRWSDEDDDVVAWFRARPGTRMIVLGRPGAGKTVLALLFTLGMLAVRKQGEPVPVLLTVSSWDPRTEHMHAWIARRLNEDYKALDAGAALRLVRGGYVLPVLDGLDELPADLHVPALDGIDRATGNAPLVLTCRNEDYREAVAVGGTTVSEAAVVELREVDVADAIDFLSTGPEASVARWTPVFEHLREHPGGPLAAALTTPLMVDLARTAYRNPTTDPAELLDSSRFGEVAEIEHHLLDQFVPAKYDPHPAAPLTGESPATTRTYRQDKAGKWLAFLATDLRQRRFRDIAWWRLPGQRTVLAVLLAVAFASMWVWDPLAMLVAGLICGVGIDWYTVGLLRSTVCPASGLLQAYARVVRLVMAAKEPQRVSPRLRGRTPHIAGKTARGFAIGVLLGVVPGWPSALVLGGVGAVLAGLRAWLMAPSGHFAVPDPVLALRHDRRSVWLVMLLAVLCVFGGLAAGGQVSWDPAGVRLSLTFAIGVGLGLVWMSAWAASVLGRTWWALCGKLPWRLMTFLDDAHRRGVLRQAGMVFEFHHVRLQNRLAGGVTTSSADFPDTFDGLGWHTAGVAEGLPHNWVRDLFEDSAGRMWAGTSGGVAICDDDGWRAHTTDHGLPHNAVTCVREDAAGRIWLATEGGLCRWAGARFVPEQAPSRRILTLHVDREHRLWAGSDSMNPFTDSGLHMFDGTDWHSFTVGEGMVSRDVRKVFEDSHGRIWVIPQWYSVGRGAGYWDGTSWRWFSVAHGLIDDHVRTMAEDTSGSGSERARASRSTPTVSGRA
jgi:hypothetical protein